MFGLGRTVTLALVGWLWADLLLGMFAIFLAANTASAAVAQTPQNAIDPQVVQIQLQIDGATLLGSNVSAVQQEQARIAKAVSDQLQSQKGSRRVAVALAFASEENPLDGDKIAKAATANLTTGPFAGAVVKPYHELVTGDQGRTLSLELYLYY
jgi:hypothetical protein